jgi:hypothetical protein
MRIAVETDAPMSRDARPSRSEPTSDTRSARRGAGFEAQPEAEEIQFGCSMLSRIRLQPRRPSDLAVIRCSLGYALHCADDVAKCLAVEGPSSCWKTVPSWRLARQERLAAERVEPEPAVADAAPGSRNGTVAVDEIAATVLLDIVEAAADVEGEPVPAVDRTDPR